MLKEIYDQNNYGMQFIISLSNIKKSKEIGYFIYNETVIKIYSNEKSRMLYISLRNSSSGFINKIIVCEFNLVEWLFITSCKSYRCGKHQIMVSDKKAKAFYDFCMNKAIIKVK